jgi:salicylate hydroxylase
MLINRWP